VVQRRDSIGMAAKEYTEKMLHVNNESAPSTELRRSLQSDTNTNTDGVKSLIEKQVYTEGTFNDQTEMGKI
jgi:hypothetical protein